MLGLMMSLKSSTVKVAAAVFLAAMLATSASAQSPHRTRRESTANRRARIARIIAETYSHRWEAGAGGGYERFRSGQYKQQNNEITFWGSAQYSLTPNLGVTGLAGGGFGNAKLGNNPENAVNPQIQNYTFLAGPSYRFVKKQNYAVSGFAAAGVGYGRFSTGPHDFPPTTVGLWPSGINAGFSVGANLDYNFYPNLALRVTPQYLGTTFGGTLQNNKALNFGLVYRFGHIR